LVGSTSAIGCNAGAGRPTHPRCNILGADRSHRSLLGRACSDTEGTERSCFQRGVLSALRRAARWSSLTGSGCMITILSALVFPCSRFSCSRSVLAAARRWSLSSSPATSGYRPAAATPSPPSPLLGRPLRTIKRFVPNRAPSTTDLKQLDARRLIEKPLSAPPSVIAPRADA
jgi:hypothetical protein